MDLEEEVDWGMGDEDDCISLGGDDLGTEGK